MRYVGPRLGGSRNFHYWEEEDGNLKRPAIDGFHYIPKDRTGAMGDLGTGKIPQVCKLGNKQYGPIRKKPQIAHSSTENGQRRIDSIQEADWHNSRSLGYIAEIETVYRITRRPRLKYTRLVASALWSTGGAGLVYLARIIFPNSPQI